MEEDTLANDYSNFLRIDTSNYVNILEDDINKTLANLEKYGRIVDLMKSDSSVNWSTLIMKKTELLSLCEKIRKLEIIVNIIKRNVEEIENLVLNAETDLKTTTEGKLRSFFKNVIFKKKTASSPNASDSMKKEICFVQPNVFNTSELFSGAGTSN